MFLLTLPFSKLKMGGVFSDCAVPKELDIGCSQMQDHPAPLQRDYADNPRGIRAAQPQKNQS